MAKKGRSTQSLVNTFPLWSNIRVDEQSLGYQFLNVVGQRLDDLRKQVARAADNFFLPTSIVSDIDVFYSYQLPGDYEFVKEDDDDTEFTYTPPTVSGLYNGVFYDVQIAENNDVESFWYTPAPDRITLADTVDDSHFLASGYCSKMLFNPVTPSGLLHIPNNVVIKMSGGTSYITLQDDNLVRKTVVQVEGVTREGRKVTEEIIFVQDETLKTFHEFKSIASSGLRVYGVEDPETTTIEFYSGDFNAEDYLINYELDSVVWGQDIPYFWAVGSGMTSATRTLDLRKYDADDLDLRLEGWISKHTVVQQELQNVAGSGIIPGDLAVEPHSDNIWIVDSGHLYLYSADFPYPNLSVLNGKDYDANSVIEPNTYYAVINEEIELNYVWRRPVTGMVAHRAWVLKPDGTKKSLVAGVETTYDSSSGSWVYGEPKLRKIRPTEFYTLDQYGNYVYTLEVRYTDETTSVDKRVISVLYQRPRAEFDLTSLGIITTVSGIDFDSEYKLWVADANGMKYQIDRHYDRMLVDFDRKIIYVREPYDQVRVW